MKPRDYFQYILGIVIVIGFFGLLFVLVFSKIPNENSDLLNVIILEAPQEVQKKMKRLVILLIET